MTTSEILQIPPPPAPPGAVGAGRPQPLGATVDRDGVNFSVFSERATAVQLLLFDRHDAPEPSRVIALDPDLHHSYHFWHCRVDGLGPGQVYAYRMDGPGDTRETGSRFNPRKVLLDPYARANINSVWDRAGAVGPQDNCATAMRSMVVDLDAYDWEGDQPLRTPLADTVIYEAHVRGMTASPTSGVADPGTFPGLIEKIPHLKELGITAVELLPVFDFDETQVLRSGPDGEPLRNYWGYDPFGFFAPHTGYCADARDCQHITEFRDLVKALHRAGIEVILDVVFNHTSEGNENGPAISFRGQANEAYYHLWAQDRRHYMDFTGCGNSVNANHPAVAKFIIECLEYWVTEHHVDGFRFDLASELSRGAEGYELEVPPLLWGIELSGILSESKIIAEPWDGSGLYQVGRFPGNRWSQWNGPFRDEVRRFVRGDAGLVGSLATRIGGSRDLFSRAADLPTNGINFITCHDGFTMNDLVSYNRKDNYRNGESDADGSFENYSWNCGVEGPTDDDGIDRLRVRQTKNLAALLLLSRGVPMLLAGDEFRNSQGGNNNAYCQDGPTSWLDWDQAAKETEVHRFFQGMVALRKRHPALRAPRFFTGRVNERGLPDVSWHGTTLGCPGWDDPEARVLSFTLAGFDGHPDLHVVLNMFHLGLDFELPVIDGRCWALTVDTARAEGQDLLPPGSELPVSGSTVHAHGRSVVVLTSLPEGVNR
ncbi:glycogen debranching protein GlgX [Streptacidiphilus cavernicola]|uniref:Glycogen debranching protein GlgX n=1 Tax=Streptacidiphilus cavernicola TaxID=3342716 RepID=A0ABV6VQS4_9ACTN